ncbi:MAG: hypothetical protein LUG62_08620 [Clostridiales bacterium]|nr:hypothetical protein [Clostridiales bacterium]
MRSVSDYIPSNGFAGGSQRSVYIPLKGLRGEQLDSTKFRFSWESAENDYQAHFLWIYKEYEPFPQMRRYGQCDNNSVQVAFQYDSVPLLEIRRIQFLLFLSETQMAPTGEDIDRMSRDPAFLCQVCCGTGEIYWRWIPEETRCGLLLNSQKEIPEGLLYYEYIYGGKNFRFSIPGKIHPGSNYYGNICFPSLPEPPRLLSQEKNLSLVMDLKLEPEQNQTVSGGKRGKGFFGWLEDIFRH